MFDKLEMKLKKAKIINEKIFKNNNIFPIKRKIKQHNYKNGTKISTFIKTYLHYYLLLRKTDNHLAK